MSAAETPGSDAARVLDAMYRRHVGGVYRYAYAVLGNRADAEDVTQTTFVNALRALERGERPARPESWLIVIARNLVRQRWRQAAARPTEVALLQDVAAAPPAEDETRLDDLVRAMQRIPPAQREALVMRELEGRPYAEIGEILGLTTGALETLLFRARRSLADELQNLVTCDRAELDLSRRLDGRLGRKERRRLDEHLAECTACARLAAVHHRYRRAFKGLAVLPLPVGLTLVKSAPTASAAIGLATIGGGAAGGAATASGGVAGGLLGGTLAKVAAVVVAGTLATGAGVEGAALVRDHARSDAVSATSAPATPSRTPGAAAPSRSRQQGVGGTARSGPASRASATGARRDVPGSGSERGRSETAGTAKGRRAASPRTERAGRRASPAAPRRSSKAAKPTGAPRTPGKGATPARRADASPAVRSSGRSADAVPPKPDAGVAPGAKGPVDNTPTQVEKEGIDSGASAPAPGAPERRAEGSRASAAPDKG